MKRLLIVVAAVLISAGPSIAQTGKNASKTQSISAQKRSATGAGYYWTGYSDYQTAQDRRESQYHGNSE